MVAAQNKSSHGSINALFLRNDGGQDVELKADNSVALNAILRKQDYNLGWWAARVESISDVVKDLGVISCDSCEGKSASFDVYVDSDTANVPFLKRYCSDCIQNIPANLFIASFFVISAIKEYRITHQV